MGALITLIKNADAFTPKSLGRCDVLVVNEQIVKIGQIESKDFLKSSFDFEEIDASDSILIPGLIDPHEHLIGGSGEKGGFHTQTPEIFLSELIRGGTTTVVGTLGVDTSTKTMGALIGKVKALRSEGLSAYAWGGGYHLPAPTLTGSIHSDILFIDEIIGAGEVAIADHRAPEPSAADFAKLVIDAASAGLLSGKCGVTHVHVGAGSRRLKTLRTVLDEYEIKASCLYATHIERTAALVKEGADLSLRGCYVDFDTEEHDLAKWFRFFREQGGDPAHLTASSDAGITGPETLFGQIRDSVLNHQISLDDILPCVTSNTADVLKLNNRGRIQEHAAADLVLMTKKDMEITDVFASGRRFMKNGSLVRREKFLEFSKRRIELKWEEKR